METTARSTDAEPSERGGAAASEGLFRAIFEQALDASLVVGDDGFVVEANAAACALFDAPRGELVGRHATALYPSEDLSSLAEMFDGHRAPASGQATVSLRRRDGSTLWLRCDVRASIAAGRHLVTLHDVSAERAIEASLVEADRRAAAGTLAAGVAHEVSNALAYVSANLELVARGLARAERTRPTSAGEAELTRMLAAARGSADRARVLTRGLTTYSRGDEERRRPVDLRRVMDDALQLTAPSVGGRARILKAYAAAPLVEANDARLGQVVLNLLMNALQALDRAPSDRHEIRVSIGTDAQGNAVLDVSDTGPGIPAALLPRIFDPFVTTKPSGEGTGLGLFVSRSIVASHGGEISATSAAGGGTTMRVLLRPYVPPFHVDDGWSAACACPKASTSTSTSTGLTERAK